MSGWRGILAGALALAALEVVVQPQSAGRVGGLLGNVGTIARRFLSPGVPAFAKPAASKTSSTSSATVVPISSAQPYPSPGSAGLLPPGTVETTT